MVPRPFALNLRIGIDICKIDRIKGIVAPRHKGQTGSSAFAKKLFTPREYKYFQLRFMKPAQYRRDIQGQNIANYLAGRWAAKEACVKAVKPRKLTHADIEIWPGEDFETTAIILDETGPEKQSSPDSNRDDDAVKDDESEMIIETGSGSPTPGQENRYMHALDNVPSHEHIKGQAMKISLSHDTDYACAVAVYADPELETHPGGAFTEQRLANIERELMELRRSQGERLTTLME